ncbi:hypothetical protein EX30DRAFT_342520 [Ascodesmis nigricans]|uniref:Uncharacterized protein n=1 Tax=Ascodesmis nigricans TaxID=341454 RepID=A0A4S2MPV8_9PEZI|nr:hypothetical protein EX30DRAFT_342520 [Ascodesmis nigricans]
MCTPPAHTAGHHPPAPDAPAAGAAFPCVLSLARGAGVLGDGMENRANRQPHVRLCACDGRLWSVSGDGGAECCGCDVCGC